MCFIGKLDAKMGSDFLLEVLKDTELQMAVEGVGSLYACWKVANCFTLLAASALGYQVGATWTCADCRWKLCGWKLGSLSP